MNDDDILDYIEDSRNLRALGTELEFAYDENDMLILKQYVEPTRLQGITEGLQRVAGTTASIGAGAVGATLGFPTDLASLFVSIGKSVGAEDGKKLETFANTFETLSKENYGSQFYKGLFDNFIDDLNISDQKKKDFKAGFVGGEFLGVGNVGREAAKKAPAVAKSIRETSEEVGEAAQKRVAENQGSMTMSSMGVGEMGNMVDKGLSKLAPNKGEVINLKPKVDRLNFYSKAEEVTNQLKQNKGTGQQYRQQLLKAGVKPDEIEWLGLDDVLNKGKITKQELQDQINANRIELDEVELSGDVDESATIGMGSNFGNLRQRFLGGEKENYTVNNKGTAVFTFVDPETKYIITGNNDQGYEIFRSETDMKDGKNYLQRNFGRGRQSIGSFDEAVIQAEQIMVEEGIIDPPKQTTRFGEYTEPGGDNYREFLIKYNDPKVQFDKSHFDESNVIAHFRTKDRITINDKKVFYIEEIQSDWGQQARQRGLKPSEEELAQLKIAEQNLINRLEDSYKNVFVPKRIEKLIKENNLILDENVKVSLESDEKLIPFNEFYKLYEQRARTKDAAIEKFEILKMLRKGSLVFDGDKRYLPKRSKDKDGYLMITLPQTEQNVLVEQILKNRKKQFSPISKAPFITDTDKWTQLTLKRILSKAVDEGYDFVSLTPGKAQMDRWNDEGVAKFYDEIVPKNAEKIVKKLDKNAIQKQRIAILPPYLDALRDEFLTGSDFKERFSIELTPQLKEKVKKGMAMFSATPLVVGQENE